MKNIITINETDSAHLENVKSQMLQLGSPTIKAVWHESHNAFVALEGSHRVAAAAALGIEVKIEEVEYSDAYLIDLGIEDAGYPDDTVEDYVDTAWKRDHLMYEVNIY